MGMYINEDWYLYFNEVTNLSYNFQKMATDEAVLSLGDALIRESDLNLLSGPFWLNDRLIGFYFEYLHLHKFESSSGVCFISPEVSQFLKLANFEEIPIFLEPLELEKKDLVLLAVNNASDPSGTVKPRN